MASGKTSTAVKSSSKSGSKNINAGKKRNTGRKRTSRAAETAKKNKMRDDVILLFTTAFAIILFLSNCNLAGSLGERIKWLMFGVMGIVAYIFPVVLAASILFLVVNRDLIGVARIKTAAVYVLMMIVSALWLRITEKPDIQSPIGMIFTYSAKEKTSGGFVGGMLCKMLSPLGLWGSLVVLSVLGVICIIVITEKSFINGIYHVKDSGSRFVKNAREDYTAYREHSNERMGERAESEEEFLKRREKERAARIEEKYRRKEQQLREKKEREERILNARMNRKVRGVTQDTTLCKEPEVQAQDIDIHEIGADLNRQDDYSRDIYEPSDKQSVQNDSFEPQGVLDAAFDEKNLDYQEQQAEEVIPYKEMQHFEETQKQSEQPAEASITSAAEHKTEKNHKKYVFPPVTLLAKASAAKSGGQDRENKETALRLQQTLQSFGVKATITDISCGPAVTRYELQPEQGVKVSRIVSLSDDIKLNLAAADIRIEAPIPGKAAIGIEVPNKEAGSVYLRDLLESDTFKKQPSPIAFAAGKDIAGKPIVADIAKMPHLLIAGATGSGKSVCINTIIMSILYKATPDEVKLIMIDPKMVELSAYNGIPHLLTPVVTDPKKASGALNWAVVEMTERYKKFTQMNVRDIKGYNSKIEKLETAQGEEKPEKMPHMVIIIDELADLMMVAPGEVEDAICRLAQLARAAGIHLVIATQRPSVNVITGLIKANVPSRIAFSVSSGVDSRTIIDMNGAEKLLGKGDMLFFPSGYPKPVRVQGAFCTDEEVARVVGFLKEHTSEDVTYNEEITNQIVSAPSVAEQQGLNKEDERDSYFAEAGRFVIGKEKGSIGMLQRYYKIGFNRAGRIMDQLAETGVVGPELGTKPRKVEMTLEEFEDYLQKNNIS
ncbi:MAG: DNA translocase FtsK [Eubacteriales bacterium]|nr:DNA translocase FtsK [Eubacteriales bacterium]